METIDKLDIAREMLEASIHEYLDEERYFAAYNLASVAEELFGKMVNLSGKKNALAEKIESVKVVSRALNCDATTNKEWKRIIGNLKNSIKHMDSEYDRYVEANIRDDSQRKIAEAINNYDKLDLGLNKIIERFAKGKRDRSR